ncbi:hypothetical protein FKW77_004931 [Venturia effusa]|uniref:Uncharacterized protein n=1 Tax=Venturia effusa TaxID=50376 RepID=A0A517KWB1_9PEZI|nr:hypothetical protein FKW77_004931 [Venturia effusa]
MHFSTLLTLTLTTLAAATPYHGQYGYPANTNTTAAPLPDTYVNPTSTPTKPTAKFDLPLINSTTTGTTATQAVVKPSGTGAPPSSTLVPFTGASAPVKEASLALVVLAGVVVVWF